LAGAFACQRLIELQPVDLREFAALAILRACARHTL